MSRFEIYTDHDESIRWRLKDTDGEIIAVGLTYEDVSAASRHCELVSKWAAGAEVVESKGFSPSWPWYPKPDKGYDWELSADLWRAYSSETERDEVDEWMDVLAAHKSCPDNVAMLRGRVRDYVSVRSVRRIDGEIQLQCFNKNRVDAFVESWVDPPEAVLRIGAERGSRLLSDASLDAACEVIAQKVTAAGADISARDVMRVVKQLETGDL